MPSEQPAIATMPTGIVIETARLRLRAFDDDDLADLVALADDWEVAQWLAHLPHPYREADGRGWIAHVRQAHAAGRPRSFALALKDTGRLIGGGGIDGSSGDGSAEPALGYWLGRPHWGQGYAREAVAALIHYAFELLGLDAIRAYTDPANTASRQVVLACGFKEAGMIDLLTPTHHGALRAPLFRRTRNSAS